MGGYIGAIAHANGRDVKTIYAVGVPPVGRAEETNLLLSRELGDEFAADLQEFVQLETKVVHLGLHMDQLILSEEEGARVEGACRTLLLHVRFAVRYLSALPC